MNDWYELASMMSDTLLLHGVDRPYYTYVTKAQMMDLREWMLENPSLSKSDSEHPEIDGLIFIEWPHDG